MASGLCYCDSFVGEGCVGTAFGDENIVYDLSAHIMCINVRGIKVTIGEAPNSIRFRYINRNV